MLKLASKLSMRVSYTRLTSSQSQAPIRASAEGQIFFWKLDALHLLDAADSFPGKCQLRQSSSSTSAT
jgi:hypothetical protein